MIKESERTKTQLKNNRYSNFEVFFHEGSAFCCILEENHNSNESNLLIIDFKTGKIVHTIGFGQDSLEKIEDMGMLGCLVVCNDNSLTAIYYDGVNRKEYEVEKNIYCEGEVFNFNFCVFKELVVYLMEKEDNAVGFYDMRENKFIGEWRESTDQCMTTGIKNSSLLPYVFVELVGRFGSNRGQSIVLIDCLTRIQLYELKGTSSLRADIADIFIDYSGEFSFGTITKSYSSDNRHLWFFKPTYHESLNLEKTEVELHNSFRPYYSFGKDFFLGKPPNHIKIIQTRLKIDNKAYNDVVVDLFHESVSYGIPQMTFKNGGRDIYIFRKKEYGTTNLLDVVFLHFVNTNIMKSEVFDLDERDRVEYIRDLEDNKISLVKICIFGIDDFSILRILF